MFINTPREYVCRVLKMESGMGSSNDDVASEECTGAFHDCHASQSKYTAPRSVSEVKAKLEDAMSAAKPKATAAV